ncbi:hypothetical protein BUALT_Bualt07G0023300 [Buddleja alternifolia]|uniref:G-patch domain-containing protein n=1 Tax=Buddleja alternifolia TaxID=168488 RepID=A0AAV6XDY9_9LAMI|nr:hypothetical protein BUALT_Bualt07G0023300 [Buddleja alternifolia]
MAESIEQHETDCAFQWDENSQLYYHASTGFYHDPHAGWYYSSSDGNYYKFEDGNYVLLEYNQAGDQHEMNNTICKEELSKARIEGGEIVVEPSLDRCNSSDQSDFPPPPSEWLEDTLIDMYLSGYSNQRNYVAASDMIMPVETNCTEKLNSPNHEDNDIEELEEGEWIPDDPDFWSNLSENILDEGISQEEENWQAQYGQVSQLDEEWMSELQLVDLWDWALVRGTKKGGKTEVARLVGRLKKRSSNLHPSVPSGAGILKTAPVCETHLDMVRVTSGRIYRLRIPSLQYLASLSVYDASNPTKDWGFPQLCFDKHIEKLPKDLQSEPQSIEGLDVQKDKSVSSATLCSSKKENVYRDRAAERRALHGGFGIGPGQKKLLTGDDSAPSSPTLQPEEAAAESLNISFGEGSYARKILKGMGWKEGETLGCSMKGLSEPLQANGNKGTAGLGWDHGKRMRFSK